MAKENYKALTENLDLNALNSFTDKVSNQSININQMVDKVVSEYCEPLDNLMKDINELLNDSIRPSDEELDAWSCKLASCLYFVGEGVETIGVKQDVAKAYKMEKFNNAYDEASGTISDKTALAELKSQQEYLVHTIYSRAYKKATQKLELGNEMLSSIKKVISRRMGAFALSVKDKSNFAG